MGLTNTIKTALLNLIKADASIAALPVVYADDSVSSVLESSEMYRISAYPYVSDNTSGSIGKTGHYDKEYTFYIGCAGQYELDNDEAQTQFYDFMDLLFTAVMDKQLWDGTTRLTFKPMFVLKSFYLHEPDDSQPFMWVGLHTITITTRVARNC